jgi:phosphofructokinase-like protein
MTPHRRLGVLTSGGDCPGLNAVLRGLTCRATQLGWEVVGFHQGFEGLLEGGTHEILTLERTSGILPLGGTLLGTTSKGHFIAKVGGGSRTMVPQHVMVQARATLDSLGISALIAIGGDGSLTTAQQLHEAGFRVIGVPKTIDNDLEATSMTFGFDSAVACVSEALDRLRTTATSHSRVLVIEVMGRHAGWIALHGGLAGGADIILLPEIPFDFAKIADAIQKRDASAQTSSLVVVAEGARPVHGSEYVLGKGAGEYKLGGAGHAVASEIAQRTGKETRTCVLGHLQRGGTPTHLDRILGLRFGVKAAELVDHQEFGQMVSYQNDEITSVPIADAVSRLHLVSPQSQMVQTARAIGISFGD